MSFLVLGFNVRDDQWPAGTVTGRRASAPADWLALSRGFNFSPFDVFNYFVCLFGCDACCGRPKLKMLPKLLAFPN